MIARILPDPWIQVVIDVNACRLLSYKPFALTTKTVGWKVGEGGPRQGLGRRLKNNRCTGINRAFYFLPQLTLIYLNSIFKTQIKCIANQRMSNAHLINPWNMFAKEF